MAEPTYPREPTTPVTLAAICDLLGLPEMPGQVTGVSLSTDSVSGQDLYAALPGARTHGARFAEQAVRAGAAAILTDFEGQRIMGAVAVPVLVHPNPRAVLGQVSALVFGNPGRDLQTFGVTGTNGKTTVTYMLAAALRALGVPSGLIGTTGTWIGDHRLPTARTTPEAPDVQALMALMRAQDTRALAMEVSSHALVLGRVDGVRFDVAAFTNLSPDHLDFHGDMEAYYLAKASLFSPERTRCAVIDTDDEWGRRLAGASDVPVVSYGLAGPADWTAKDIRMGASGSTFQAVRGAEAWPVSIGTPGEFNVANGLCAIAMLVAAGYPPEQATRAMAGFHGVPGRMEVVQSGKDSAPVVIVDYAHTPDAVERALRAVRPLTQGKIWCVLGCGGDRDAGKRPVMGQIAAQLSDHVIITDDNPRSEYPADIRAAVLSGALRVAGADVVEMGDRSSAIKTCVSAAGARDTVLILGKGHETGQEIAGTVHPFDDRIEAAAALEARS